MELREGLDKLQEQFTKNLFFSPLVPRIQINATRPHRSPAEQNFENTEVEELIAMLRETENLEEQGDILQYLVDTQGLDFNTGKSKFSTSLMIFKSLKIKQS